MSSMMNYGLIDNKKIINIFKDEIKDFKLKDGNSLLEVKTIFYRDFHNPYNDKMLITVFINNEILFKNLYSTYYNSNMIKQLIKIPSISIEFYKDELLNNN